MTIVDDNAARDQAVDTEGSFFVDGAAGTGKSELCYQRYLFLLAEARQPEEILFLVDGENHARRITARLTSALNSDAPTAAEAMVRERARELRWNLQGQPERLQIRTLAALALQLVASAPVTSGCGAGVRVTDDPESYYRIAARALLRTLDHDERVAPNLETLLLHLDNDLLRAERLLAGLLRRRVELQRCLRMDRPEANRDSLHAALAEAVGMALTDVAAALPPDCADELVELSRLAATNVAAPADASSLKACRDLHAVPAADASQLDAWRGFSELLLLPDGTVRTDYGADQGFGSPEQQSRISILAARLAECPGFISRLAALRDISEVRYTHLQWTVLHSLLAVLPRVIADLSRAFRALGEMDLTELLQGATRALSAGQAEIFGPDGLQHLIIDDFHELPYAAIDLIGKLTGNWSDDDRRTTFITGNPFASVRRDAGAQPALYLTVRQEGLGRRTLKPLQLVEAQRASAEITEWVNDVFSAAAADGVAGEGGMPFWTAQESDTQGGEVIVAAVSGDAAAEAEYIATLIGERSDFRQGTVGILLANPADAGLMIEMLRERGIRCASDGVDLLGSHPVVRDLHALTRALLHLGDRIAWLSLLRAPWCGLTLADLHRLVADSNNVTVWELIIDEQRRARLSEDGQQRLSRVKRVLAQTIAERGRRDLRSLVEGVWTALGGAVCVANEHELAHCQAFFEMLANIDDGGEPDSLEALDAAVATLREARPPADGDVVVASIRRARRRVYDTVILAGISTTVPRPEQDDALRWLVRPGPRGDAQLLLAPVNPEARIDGINRWLEGLQSDHHDNELRRLLYVGASRARKNLIVVAAPPPADDGWQTPLPHSPLRTIWSQIGNKIPAQPAATQVTPVRGTGAIRRLPSSWLLPEAPQPKVWNVARHAPAPVNEHLSSLNGDGRIVARVLTRMLAEIGRDGPADWAMRSMDGLQSHFQRLFAMMGMTDNAVSNTAERAATAIAKLLDDDKWRWLLDHNHRDAHTPMTLSGWLDEQLTSASIDRGFVDGQGTRWLVEFQFPELAGDLADIDYEDAVAAAQQRLQQFARLTRRLEAAPIKTALYFPLSARWKEWDPEV